MNTDEAEERESEENRWNLNTEDAENGWRTPRRRRMLYYSALSVKRRIASAARTAVSVRRIFSPRETSRNPAARAEAISSSAQPPSGPLARVTEFPFAFFSASRTGRASR